MITFIALTVNSRVAAEPLRPTKLQVNYQRSPSLGVGPTLRFSWMVPPPQAPPSPTAQPYAQRSYQIVITDAVTNHTAWDSGVVMSSASINVELNAKTAKLLPGRAFFWTVACSGGPMSSPAEVGAPLYGVIWCDNCKQLLLSACSSSYMIILHPQFACSVCDRALGWLRPSC